MLDGRVAFELTVGCNTCPFYFERRDGANSTVPVDKLVAALNAGLYRLEDDVTRGLAEALPRSNYDVLLAEAVPNRIDPWSAEDYFVRESVDLFGLDAFYNLPHFTHTCYHRLQTSEDKRGGFFEFLVPMVPESWLSAERIVHYSQVLKDGGRPTCFCLSMLDVRSPATRQTSVTSPFDSHTCLLHVLLDGHHKLEAARLSEKPISLISFLARDYCAVPSAEDIEHALRELR